MIYSQFEILGVRCSMNKGRLRHIRRFASLGFGVGVARDDTCNVFVSKLRNDEVLKL